jgi:SOUL heme-binding protein
MLGRLQTVIGQIAESVLAIVGVRAGTEEPRYGSEPLTGGVEIRRYGPRIAAETVVGDGDEEAARSEGFRRLAGYIFGANHRRARVAMTAPVAQQPIDGGSRIAMTAPVAQSADAEGGWRVRFYMPSKWSMEDLPTPDDDRVGLVEVPAEAVAVLRFSGDRGAGAVAERTEWLAHVLRATGFAATGTPTAWFYDPPWTLPFLRRNEVAVPIDAD